MVLSSLGFVSMFDSVVLVAYYSLGAIVGRVVVDNELIGMREARDGIEIYDGVSKQRQRNSQH